MKNPARKPSEVFDLLEKLSLSKTDLDTLWRNCVVDGQTRYGSLGDKELMTEVDLLVRNLTQMGPLICELRRRFKSVDHTSYLKSRERRATGVGLIVRSVFDQLNKHAQGLELKDVAEFCQDQLPLGQLRFELESTHRFVQHENRWFTVVQFQKHAYGLNEEDLEQYCLRQVPKVIHAARDLVTVGRLRREIFGKFAEAKPALAANVLAKTIESLGLVIDEQTQRIKDVEGVYVEARRLIEDWAGWLRAIEDAMVFGLEERAH